jgi:ParB family transcriptional regulator, chromosome partitioning protein
MASKKQTPAKKPTVADKRAAAAQSMAGRMQLSSMVAASTGTQKKYPATIAVDDIVIDEQVRTTFDDASIIELAGDMKANGQLQRVLVSKRPEGKYFLIAGERRVRAARYNKWETIDAEVREVVESEIGVLQLAENIQREDLSMIDKARGVAKIRDKLIKGRKATLPEIAEIVKKTPAWVSECLQLLELPEQSKRAVDEGIITDQTTANRLARVERTAGAEKAKELVQLLKDGGGKTREVVTAALKDAKAIKGGAAKAQKPAVKGEPGRNDGKKATQEVSEDHHALAEALFGSVRMFSELSSLAELSVADNKLLGNWLKAQHARGLKARGKGIDIAYVVNGIADEDSGAFKGKAGLVALAAYLTGFQGEAFSLNTVYQHLIKPK